MYRKIIIIAISVFMSSSNTSVQALTVVVVLFAALYIQYINKPYNHSELNHMETEALFTATITIYCGLFYLTSYDNQYFKMFLFCIMAFGNIYFLCFWLYYMVQAIVDIFIKMFPQLKHAMKKGDAFEENFLAEHLKKVGTFMSPIEGKIQYTFMKSEPQKENPMLEFNTMSELYESVLIEEIGAYSIDSI